MDLYFRKIISWVLSETLEASHVVKCIEKAKQSRYIETFYNTVRIHSHCGYLSPNEYEEQYLKNLETDVTNLAS